MLNCFPGTGTIFGRLLNRPKPAARILLTLCARDWRKLERQACFRVEYGAARQVLQPTPPQNSVHVYEVRPRSDKRGVDLISDALPIGRMWYRRPKEISS